MFSKNTNTIIYWLQLSAAQKMLDFDFLCDRNPSIKAFINEGKEKQSYKLFFGGKEILIPSFPNFSSVDQNIKIWVDTLVNFASHRSAWKATKEAISSNIFKNIIIIAEWIRERETLEIIELNKKSKINIVWPSTVWAMYAWWFRAWNTWWSLENIIDSKLYQTWSVGFVSKSGWMSNELRRVIAGRTDGTNLSVAIGWDKYNIMQFVDVVKLMEKMPEVKMIVMLWEIGWRDELIIWDMIKTWVLTKPVVAWCIWTIWDKLKWNVQFGHAWAKSNAEEETSNYKNKYLKDSWAIVPDSYMDFGDKIKSTFDKLNIDIKNTNINIDSKLEIMNSREKTNFTSTISDERWEELTYNGKLISDYSNNWSFANVISNLWLKRDLPDYGTSLINTILILLADHGPAVSWATNAIVTSRAWNDLKSSLISGLATIWPRFGWAIDWAANYFSLAVRDNISAEDFVKSMRSKAINIPWIWHKVKSKFNPDARCKILLELSKNFPNKKHLNFALEVEKLTLEKKANLILNVDWLTAVLLLDLFEDIWMDFTETRSYIDAWIFNAFFILARTTGFIGHIIDQKILKEPLYRTPWDDIMYEE